eukprot:3255527-Pleurochrysis_carterae.AAC.1
MAVVYGHVKFVAGVDGKISLTGDSIFRFTKIVERQCIAKINNLIWKGTTWFTQRAMAGIVCAEQPIAGVDC